MDEKSATEDTLSRAAAGLQRNEVNGRLSSRALENLQAHPEGPVAVAWSEKPTTGLSEKLEWPPVLSTQHGQVRAESDKNPLAPGPVAKTQQSTRHPRPAYGHCPNRKLPSGILGMWV